MFKKLVTFMSWIGPRVSQGILEFVEDFCKCVKSTTAKKKLGLLLIARYHTGITGLALIYVISLKVVMHVAKVAKTLTNLMP